MQALARISRPGAIALGLLTAIPAWAEGGPSQESILRFEQAVAAAGCEVDEVNRDTVLQRAEMSETEASVIVSFLVQKGDASLDEGRMVLRAGACAG